MTDAAPQGKFAFIRRLSAGVITGAADDDPSGIATYSQVGAAYGYATMWSLFLVMPLMIAIQAISARIGRASGKGIADNMRTHYWHGWAYILVAAVVIANVINLAADVGAMGAALKLLIGGPALAYATLFAIGSLLLQMFVPFSKYSPILKVLCLSLFAYVATVFIVHVPWGEVAKGILLPKATFDAKYAVAIVAVLGTTISPFLFIWQAAQEVEEIRETDNPRKPLKQKPGQGPDAIKRIGIDTVSGMVFSNIVAGFIILTAAVVLHAHGKTDIQTSAQAAEALRPVAGKFAFALFSAGMIGTGLLCVPILAGSSGYAICGALGLRYGLAHKPKEAKAFYSVLIGVTLVGIALNFSPIDPIKALYWSAVVNGVAAVPMMVMIMIMAMNSKVMGKFTLNTSLKVWGWAATAVMGVAAVVMFATFGKS
ncbi:divalent metal cation transporter [Rhodanobacter sp. A1T4]|uniref:NRAMP family divalent metal transporter n=1 Tax=Rhodanobacter sp. A1T4 TaxID=2723087 RepID=UPI00161302AD|nr:divalent metal cation transporter [Rhodanobacter sp. A1T4]MBB6249059.1 Mn2+/Fe2+ NRAMP family transporter [Rhodanobacter sp. A1T4]